MNKNKYKKWGHSLSRLVIGDSNSTSVWNSSETNSLTKIESHTAITNQHEESKEKSNMGKQNFEEWV